MKTPYNIDAQAHSLAHATRNETWGDPEVSVVNDPTTDINIIGQRVLQTGQLPNYNLQPLLDSETFSDIEDYASALRAITAAKHTFMQLPPEVRSRFDNDPMKAQTHLSAMSADELKKEIIEWQPKPANKSTSAGPSPPPPTPTPPSQPSAASSAPTPASP